MDKVQTEISDNFPNLGDSGQKEEKKFRTEKSRQNLFDMFFPSSDSKRLDPEYFSILKKNILFELLRCHLLLCSVVSPV